MWLQTIGKNSENTQFYGYEFLDIMLKFGDFSEEEVCGLALLFLPFCDVLRHILYGGENCLRRDNEEVFA